MMVLLLLDDDEDDDGKWLAKARGLGLLRGVNASLLEKEGSRGSSGQGVVEDRVTEFGGNSDGLSTSG